MAQKIKNPLAQALGLVLQDMRDEMGGISSSETAALLGLAASHYRMIEAGSAILQPARAIRIVQAFDKIEFIPLCQILVSIQVLDSVRQSVADMRITAKLLGEANPALAGLLKKLDALWRTIEKSDSGKVAKAIVSSGLKEELTRFITTEPVTFTGSEIDNFMSPTYEQPLSGRLYSKIGNILQGVAPFYLDAVLQLTDNLRNVTPRVTAEELAKWEKLHKNRFSHLIGIIRNPEVVLDVSTFDYSYLWEASFRKILIIHKDKPASKSEPIQTRLANLLRKKFEAEHIRYEQELKTFDEMIETKLSIHYAGSKAHDIDKILLYRDVPMNNMWAYIMVNGYVVPFIDNATVDTGGEDIYGTSLAYDETSEKLDLIRKLCSDIGLSL